MLRSAVSKAMWVGRATALALGVAVMLAVVLGLASAALGADGDFFKVGRANVAESVSKLIKNGKGPALELQVDSGPALKVNTGAKVANLNADKIDGKDSSQFVQTSEAMSAVVDSNGNLLRGEGATLATKDGPGSYFVVFNREVESCAWVATLNGSGSGEISVDRLGPNTALLEVETRDSSGTVQDRPFSLAVYC